MQSVMNHSFATVPSANIGRSQFDLSHGHKTAIDADYLYPIEAFEVLPGDTFKVKTTVFGRMTTPIFPIMDNLHIDYFWFYVPNRLVWDNWHKFLGAQDDPGDSIDYTIPQNAAPASTGFAENSLQDYLGIPPGVPDFNYNNLLERSYNLIWNEWFRDQNLQDSVTVDKNDSADTVTDYVLLKRGKRHDYFTSCLPNPQKGDTAISLPLGTTAPIQASGDLELTNQTDGDRTLYMSTDRKSVV